VLEKGFSGVRRGRDCPDQAALADAEGGVREGKGGSSASVIAKEDSSASGVAGRTSSFSARRVRVAPTTSRRR
jgi:hypothetical protein